MQEIEKIPEGRKSTLDLSNWWGEVFIKYISLKREDREKRKGDISLRVYFLWERFLIFEAGEGGLSGGGDAEANPLLSREESPGGARLEKRGPL